MINEDTQQAIALAAIIQALHLVHQVASKGEFDETSAHPVLQALIHYSPDDTLSAYGGNISALSLGIKQMKTMVNDNLNRDIAQYLMSVIAIELKLVRSNHMRHVLQTELQRLSNQLRQQIQFTNNFDENADEGDDFGVDIAGNSSITDPEAISEFALLYKQTASQTEPRIMIKGNHEFLQRESSANQIRALLLAALRAAAFFRHYGGKRLDLMMKRNQYIQALDNLPM